MVAKSRRRASRAAESPGVRLRAAPPVPPPHGGFPARARKRGATTQDVDGCAFDERARAHVAEAIDVLVELMRTGGTDAARRAAAETLIERGWGRTSDPRAKEPLVVIEVVTGIERD
ncbi:MAG: hypothetical protein ACKVSF_10220 [Alphaproteobacteria bacterium]